MTRLAIVIPYYKIDFFEETLRSVSAQTDTRFRLYIGNDASPNDPLPLIQKYFRDEDFQYFNYEENVGGQNLAMQWERILENVTEEWFQILGDDDLIPNNFVEEFYKNIDEVDSKKINVIKYAQAHMDEQGTIYTDNTEHDQIIDYTDIWTDLFIKKSRSSLSEYIFRYETFEKIRFKKYPLAWHSDDMAILEFSDFKQMFFISNAGLSIRISSKSISGNTSNVENNHLKESANLRFYEDILKHFKQLPREKIEPLMKIYLAKCWNQKVSANINFIAMYLYIGKPMKILTIPYKLYLLKRNR